jgi:chemotaxis protein CheD
VSSDGASASLETRHIVGLAQMKISSTAGDELIAYALGSCLGIAIHDPVAGVGGLLHVMLPLSSSDPEKAALNPCVYVDTGVPALFRACYQAGAIKQRLVVKVAGGASTAVVEDDLFQIGQRNFVILRKLLWKNGVVLNGEAVGGRESRTISLTVGSGEVTVKANGRVTAL